MTVVSTDETETADAEAQGAGGSWIHRKSRSVWNVTRAVMREYGDDYVSGLAGEIAYFGVLSLVPAMLLFVSLLGFLDQIVGEGAKDKVEAEVASFLTELFGSENAITDTVTSLFQNTYTGALTLAAIISLYAASRGFFAVIRALDRVYDLDEKRSWLVTRLLSLVLAIATIVIFAIVMIVFVLGPLLGKGDDLADTIGAGSWFVTFWDWFRVPAALVFLVAWTTTIFHYAPNHRTPWRSDIPGALLTTVLVVLLTQGFHLYLRLSGSANQIISTLGTGIMALLFLYFAAITLLLGGELNGVLWQRRNPGDAGGDGTFDGLDGTLRNRARAVASRIRDLGSGSENDMGSDSEAASQGHPEDHRERPDTSG